jgi:hypothetical protein
MTRHDVRHRVHYGARKAVLRLVVAEAVVALIAVSSASVADVTAVQGSATSARGSVSLFRGPPIAFPNANNPAPAVTLPPNGGIVTDSQQSIVFRAGIADVFTSGPANVSSQGTLGPSGSVTSTAIVQNPAIGGTTATTLSATCTASEAGLSGSTTVTGGRVATSDPNRNVEGDEVYTDVPTTPPVGFTLNGFVPSVSTDYYRVVFNEQVRTENTITVRAAHFYLGENPASIEQGGPVATGEVIVGEVTCGVTAVAGTTTAAPTTTAPTTTTPTTTTPTTTAPTTTTPTTTTTAPAPTTTVVATTTAPATTTTTAPATTTTTAPATTTTVPVTTTTTPPAITTTTVPTGTTTPTTTTVPIHGPTRAAGAILNGGGITTVSCPPGGRAATAPGLSAGLLSIGVLDAACSDTSATASAASVTLGMFRFGLVQSQCATGPNGTASSAVLVVNGAGILADNALISMPTSVGFGALTVTLNEVITAGGTRTVNALHVTAPGLDIIVAQSSCNAAAPTPSTTTSLLTTTTAVATATTTLPTSTTALTTTTALPTSATTTPTTTTAAMTTTTTAPPVPCNPPSTGLSFYVYNALASQVPAIVRPFVHNVALALCVRGL